MISGQVIILMTSPGGLPELHIDFNNITRMLERGLVLKTRENYIQVGGGPIEFTVEVRITAQDGTFTHWKAGLLNSKNDGEKRIIISGSVVCVQSDQVIDINTVKRLFEAFLAGDKLPGIVRWDDMTAMFR